MATSKAEAHAYGISGKQEDARQGQPSEVAAARMRHGSTQESTGGSKLTDTLMRTASKGATTETGTEGCEPGTSCYEGAPETFPMGMGTQGPFSCGVAHPTMPGGPWFIGSARGYGAEEE